MNTKGQHVVTLILILIALIVFLVWFSKLWAIPKEINPELERCAWDIKMSAGLASLTEGTSAYDIGCPTQKVTIPKKESDEQTKYDLAKSMVACHKLWGEGELTLFDEDGTYCHICQLTTFENTAKLDNFGGYLSVEPKGNTFLQQLVPKFDGEIMKEDELKFNPIGGDIDRSKIYATLFVYIRGGEQIEAYTKKIVEDHTLEAAGTGFGVFSAGSAATFIGVRVAGAAFCFIPFVGNAACAIIGAVGIGGSVLAGGMAAYVADNPVEAVSLIALKEYSPETVRELGCEISYAVNR